jgi:hypothetical protein
MAQAQDGSNVDVSDNVVNVGPGEAVSALFRSLSTGSHEPLISKEWYLGQRFKYAEGYKCD